MLQTKKKGSLENKKILNLGLTRPLQIPNSIQVETVPIIEIQKELFSLQELNRWFGQALDADGWLFSSKTAVALFFEMFPVHLFAEKKIKIIAVGEATKSLIGEYGSLQVICADEATQEGMVQTIQKEITLGKILFWPRSKQARSHLSQELTKLGYLLCEMPLYCVVENHHDHPRDLSSYDAMLFTSPSTVEAYWKIYGAAHQHEALICIGPITYQKVREELKKSCLKDLPEIFMLDEMI